MKALWNDVVLAESDETIVIEGNHYFPLSSIDQTYVKESTHRTTCPWKGEAHYYDVVVNGAINENAAWYYPQPKEEALKRVGKNFAQYVAFWNGVTITA